MKDLKPQMMMTELIAMKPFQFHFRHTLRSVLIVGAFLSAHVLADCNPNITLTKPDRIYLDHGNGTVTDTETGLMWMKCTLGRSGSNCETGAYVDVNWKQALDAAQSANGAGTFGYTDWRLPSLNELVTLTEMACVSPAINSAFFPTTLNSLYWTSSPSPVDDNSAWYVSFSTGQEAYSINLSGQKQRTNYIRLVRTAQPD
jgi:hypothetical protein